MQGVGAAAFSATRSICASSEGPEYFCADSGNTSLHSVTMQGGTARATVLGNCIPLGQSVPGLSAGNRLRNRVPCV